MTTEIAGVGADAATWNADLKDKYVLFKNCSPFTYCIREINSTQIDNGGDMNVVISMYNAIEYSNIYTKTEILKQH